ncbi:MAG: portal protein, partial [Bradyrhizobium sp.]
MPRVDGAMNRVGPSSGPGGNGSKDDSKPVALRPGPGSRKQKDADEVAAFLYKVRKNFDLAIKANNDNRKEELDDLKFKAGDQWPADIVAQRNQDKRPCITVNKIPTFLHQVTNEQRMNRPAISISPVGDKSDPEVAKMYAGIIRYCDRASQADIAYDWAFESSAGIGEGYWRCLTDYVASDSFDQTILIRRIRNTFSVYLDPAHQEPDGSDAKFGFITEMIPREDFKAQWPKADPMPWKEGGPGETMKDWLTQDRVRIAEYFEIEYEKRKLVQLSNGHVGWEDELSEEAKHYTVINERESHVPQVVWYKLTGVDILEEKEWLGETVPIIKVIGDEIDLEGRVKYSGVIRAAKDAQRTYNYSVTSEMEVVALQPKAPYIVAEGQIDGYENDWKQANTKAFPYLQYRQTDINGKPAPPPSRQPFQTQPTAWAAMKQAAAQDMMATTGIRFDATLGERVYDESGRALRELRYRGDVGSFHYTDNFARSLRRQGEIYLELIPKVFDRKQVITILREDDSEEQVMIDPAAPKGVQDGRHPQTGKSIKIYNPTYGKYGVTVTIGPSYATKRVEASESMMDFVRALAPAAPGVATAIVDLVAKNQDWPGSDEFATRLSKLVAEMHPGITSPDVKDVPPQVRAVLQGMQKQIQQMTVERAAMMKQITDQ